MFKFFFFFSSRRRHTRSLRDWSSDVCSSDLDGRKRALAPVDRRRRHAHRCPRSCAAGAAGCDHRARRVDRKSHAGDRSPRTRSDDALPGIGRARLDRGTDRRRARRSAAEARARAVTGFAGTFLTGATSRLLPASIPFRYFGAAVVFHIAAWIALVVGADGMPRFAGGLGWPLVVLHLTTLGVLAMTAIGASLQLLPVATRRSVGAIRWPAAIWWVYTPGVVVVAVGMGTGIVVLLAAGAAAIVLALAIYGVLLARNLIGAKGMPAVVAHGWGALASLVVVLATAASLAGAYAGAPGLDRKSTRLNSSHVE